MHKSSVAYRVLKGRDVVVTFFPKNDTDEVIKVYERMYPWHKGYVVEKCMMIIPEAGKPSVIRDWVSIGMHEGLCGVIHNHMN